MPTDLVLLDGEETVADLRRGLLQRATSDLLLSKNMILTNKRLILIDRRLGSYEKQYLFLKDVTGVESKRLLSIGAIVSGIVLVLLGLMTLQARGAGAVFTLVFWGVAVVLFLGSTRTGIRISTVTENYFFPLERTFAPERADQFLDLVTRETARQKGVA